ncbi:TetR family transcriptional regulator [Dictyobacter alpinus]|uniref:TetR family transcriptional regulator n=1 Tax=Dictyobacter alpinus TaxID=2014873 RepID=A0A402BJS5_9CHLR|nr:TetR/AcrR family transcriptional regulator [Dictyobacter alpinus]GCE31590.1 TetR family transcriptional regulator [Dictyobacter alpinus]
MDKTPDLIQELMVAARRKQILDAATQVFAEKGFHRATIKEIARVAGIADGTIYTYFASKDEVLLAVLDRLNETTERKQQFVLGDEQDLKAFFRAYLRQRMALLWPNAEVFRAVLPELLVNAELRKQYYEQVLAPTIAVGEQFFQGQNEQIQINIPLTVRAIAGTLLGLLLLQLMGDEVLTEQWEELPDVLTTLFFDKIS